MSAQTNATKKRSARPELGQSVSLDDLFLDEDDAYLDDEQDGFYLDEDEPSESRRRGVNLEHRRTAVDSEDHDRHPGYRSIMDGPEYRGTKPKHRSASTGSAHQDSDRPSKMERLRGKQAKDVRTRRGKKSAKQKKGQPVERRAMTGREIIQSFLIRLVTFVVLLWVLFGVIFGITPMANADMQPAISAGDLMLYYRMERKLNSDDVVVFKVDGKQYTGRIVAKNGDTVEITSDSQLKVNGSIVVENDIFYSTPQYDTDVTYPLTLGDGEYFILCDSREGAKDSRYFGAVSKKEIKGKVITIIRRSGI